jgi:hypothetical protein
MWKINLNINDVQMTWHNPVSINDIIDFFKRIGPHYRYETLSNYATALVSTNISNFNVTLTYASWIGILITLITLLLSKVKQMKDSFSNKICIILPFIGLLGYTIFLVLLYIFKFSEYESVRLASYVRYIDTYLLALLIIIFGMYVSNFNDKKTFQQNNLIIIGILLISLNLMPFNNLTILANSSVNATIEQRSSYLIYQQYIDKYVDKNSKLYFISNESKGMDYFTAKYLSAPIKINPGSSWSIGEKYGEEDVWTLEITSEDWERELLNNYDYVYLFKVDDKFISQFGKLFDSKEIHDNQLYKVDKTITGRILKLVK